jgi:hypothetical protein
MRRLVGVRDIEDAAKQLHRFVMSRRKLRDFLGGAAAEAFLSLKRGADEAQLFLGQWKVGVWHQVGLRVAAWRDDRAA